MAYVWQRWLADEFRKAGLTVREVDGWKDRGRPASTGSYDPRGPLTIHHTASTTSASNPRPTIGLLVAGRSDLPGPLAPYSTGADGVITVIAAGRCNHAGPVGRSGVLGMPYGADGNALAMGDEVDTNGTQAMPEVQRTAMATAAAVVLTHFDKVPAWLHRHADISGSGKWDLGSLTTAQVRTLTAAAITALSQEDDDMPYTPDQLTKIVRDAVAAELEPVTADVERLQAQNANLRERVNMTAKTIRDKVSRGNANVRELQAEVDDLAAALAEDAAQPVVEGKS